MQTSVLTTDYANEPRQRRLKPVKSPKVARTRTGLGVFARQRYQESQIIGEIEGEVIDDLDYSSRYCMDLGDTRCLEPIAPFRFVNHSCTPNCAFEWFDVRCPQGGEPERKLFLSALETIESGEQLTIDYCWPPAMAIRCRCGETECRGWIVAKSQLPELEALQLQAARAG